MRRTLLLVALGFAAALGQALAAPVLLNHVQIPERHEVQLNFVSMKKIPGAVLTAKVTFEDRQSWIEVSFEKMKPAVLFGGDVTSYVLWTVSRDGSFENLGELWIQQDKDKDSLKFSTGLRGFALLVTAEPYYQVQKPSELVITYNAPSTDPRAPSTSFQFADLAAATRTGFDDLSAVKYDSSNLLDLAQAQKAHELAIRLGAQELAPVPLRDAGTALAQSQAMQASGARKGAAEYARRSYGLTNEAIKVTLRRIEEREVEAQLNKRRAEVAAMEQRVADAEKQARTTAEQAESAMRDLAKTREEMTAATAEKQRIEAEKTQLQSVMEGLRNEQATLQRSMKALNEEKTLLSGRLQAALSKVADTQQSARGTIVNLPDILFDVNKATLKPEASLVIAKLAGILLIMQDLNLRVEGHTDSTGSAERNMTLSQQRAESVMNFLAGNGIAGERMKAVGYGMERPAADNATAAGRQKNRRVEIVIAEGEIKEQPPSQ